MKAKDLQLGDVVEWESSEMPFSTMRVVQIEGGFVTLFRPFVKIDDFSWSGGVLHYLGFEYVKVRRDDAGNFKLFERKILK